MCDEWFDEDRDRWVTDTCADPTHAHSSTHGSADQTNRLHDQVNRAAPRPWSR